MLTRTVGENCQARLLELLVSLVETYKGNLKEKISILEKKNQAFKIEIAELKGRLGLNLKNSSTLSSKELYKIIKDKLVALECGKKLKLFQSCA